MNKWLVSISAAAVAAGAMAAVQSANTVGYQDVSLDKQFTILGVNFTAVDGSDITLQDAVPYVAGMTKANKFNEADQIQVQNATGGYDIYFMSNGYNAKNKAVDGLDGKWTTASGSESYKVVTKTLPPGTAFWFVRYKASGVTTLPSLSAKIAGAVSKIASYDKPIDGQFKLIANPYAVDLPLNDGIPYVAGMTKANKFNEADQIQIQNATGGYDIYFMSNGYNAKNKAVDGLDGKWTTASGSESYKVVSASIPAGAGAWFVRKGSTDFEITIARPYTLD